MHATPDENQIKTHFAVHTWWGLFSRKCFLVDKLSIFASLWSEIFQYLHHFHNRERTFVKLCCLLDAKR